MAHTSLKAQWLLELSGKEVSLIRRALRGETRADEIDTAKELENQIAMYQIQQARHLQQEFEKLYDNITGNNE